MKQHKMCNKEQITNVIYTLKQNAKQIKTLLEQNHLLDKRFRFTTVDPNCFQFCKQHEEEGGGGRGGQEEDENGGDNVMKDKVDENEIIKRYIAIPIVKPFHEILLEQQQHSSSSLMDVLQQIVICHGKQSCLYSTSTLGNIHSNSMNPTSMSRNNSKKNGRLTSSSNSRTMIQEIFINTIFSYNNNDDHDYDRIIKYIDKLSSITCPTKLEIMGDDHTVVIPFQAFNYNTSTSFKSSSSSTDCYSYKQFLDEFVYNRNKHYIYQYNPCENGSYDNFHSLLWSNIAKLYNSSRIVRRGEIDPNSKIRHSGHVILWMKTQNSNYDSQNNDADNGPHSKGWITITEQKIKQSFDLTKVMFSRGNISEKIRFGKLVRENDVILDMYAGIGYYTLPALIYGKAKHVYACEWNPDAIIALKYNLIQNGVDDRATVIEGDSRVRLKEEKLLKMNIDRVNLNLLPSSEGGWRTAIRLLRKDEKGGWLHIHGNVPTAEKEKWCLWVCQEISKIYVEITSCDSGEKAEDNLPFVVCDHLERVKSFAPKVDHLVADIFVGKYLPSELTRVIQDLEGCSKVKVGMISSNGIFLGCPKVVEVPSCAFVAGILKQEWMMEKV
jgi:hypothetical protein